MVLSPAFPFGGKRLYHFGPRRLAIQGMFGVSRVFAAFSLLGGNGLQWYWLVCDMGAPSFGVFSGSMEQSGLAPWP